MGIINHDSYTTKFGIDVTDSYISIGTNSLEIQRENENNAEYSLMYIATVWASQSDRNNNKRSLQSIPRSITLNSTQMGESMYGVAYANLKTMFTNTTDA